jgi:hypothetical protein
MSLPFIYFFLKKEKKRKEKRKIVRGGWTTPITSLGTEPPPWPVWGGSATPKDQTTHVL